MRRHSLLWFVPTAFSYVLHSVRRCHRHVRTLGSRSSLGTRCSSVTSLMALPAPLSDSDHEAWIGRPGTACLLPSHRLQAAWSDACRDWCAGTSSKFFYLSFYFTICVFVCCITRLRHLWRGIGYSEFWFWNPRTVSLR